MDHLLTQGMQVATNNKYKGRKAYLQQTIKQQTKKTYQWVNKVVHITFGTHAHSQS